MFTHTEAYFDINSQVSCQVECVALLVKG